MAGVFVIAAVGAETDAPGAISLEAQETFSPSAIRQLRWSDIDLEDRTIRWRGENEKTGYEHRTPVTAKAEIYQHRSMPPEGGDVGRSEVVCDACR